MENLRDRLEKEGKIKINKKEMERLATLSEGMLAVKFTNSWASGGGPAGHLCLCSVATEPASGS